MRDKFLYFFDRLNQYKSTIYTGLILIVLGRFAYLNVINWISGRLTTGKGGIQYWIDSDRYIDGANKLLHHLPLLGRQKQFLGYMAFIAGTKWAGLGLGFVLCIQIVFALLASMALFDLARSITGSRFAGIFAASLYLLNPFITTWHLFILTESLYTSFVILSTWTIYQAINRKSPGYYIMAVLTVGITSLIRPNGWILMPSMLVIFIGYSGLKTGIKWLGSLLIVFSFVLVMVYQPGFNRGIQITTPGDLLMKGEVVWQEPVLRLSMPQTPNIIHKDWSSCMNYVFRHPFSCMKLAVARAFASLIEIRPQQSMLYRIHVLLWILPAYFLAGIALLLFAKNPQVKIILVIIGAHLFIIALTYAEPEFRYAIYFLPLIYSLSGCGMYGLLKKFILYKTAPTPQGS